MANRFPALSCIALAMLAAATASPRDVAAREQDSGQTEQKAERSQQTSDQAYPYLGVAIEALHPGVASHLPDVLIPGQGMLVTHVEPGSPAAKAGIHADDILVAYGDQKLFSMEQFAKLVMADKPGAKIDLQLVRGGKLKTVEATLAANPSGQTARQAAEEHWRRTFAWPALRLRQALKPAPREAGQQAAAKWDSFDSLTLNRENDGKFRVEIKYLDEQGAMKHHAFRGTRDDIARAIRKEKDLPDNERRHLLSAIEFTQQAVATPEFDVDR